MTNFEALLNDVLMSDCHFEAVNYPRAFELGKKSIYLTCNGCHKKPKLIEDAKFVDEYGYCLGCLERMEQHE